MTEAHPIHVAILEDPVPEDDWRLSMAILISTHGRINQEKATRTRYSKTLIDQMIRTIEITTLCFIRNEEDLFLHALVDLFGRVKDEQTFLMLTNAVSTIVPPTVPSCNMLQCRVLKAMNEKGSELGLEQMDSPTTKMIDERIAKGVH